MVRFPDTGVQIKGSDLLRGELGENYVLALKSGFDGACDGLTRSMRSPCRWASTCRAV